jgi:hypothetical protein
MAENFNRTSDVILITNFTPDPFTSSPRYFLKYNFWYLYFVT